MRVKPSCERVALAAFLAVGAERIEVVFAVLAGVAVEVRPAPRVDQRVGLLERAADEHLQALVFARIAADLEAVEVEHAGQAFDLDPGRIGLGAADVLDDLGCGKGGDQSEDDEHHQKLDQGEPGLAPAP
jgi:hypothetical protein